MKTYTILLVAIIISFTMACKPPAATETDTADVDIKATTVTSEDLQKYDETVPDACTLLSAEFVASIVGVDAEAITVKDGSSKKNLQARSCFYKWQGNIPNSGVLIQALKNPVPEEFPEWVIYFVKTKKQDGEKSFTSPGVVYSYTDWPVVGDEGAASTEAGKYLWRIGNEMAFMVAFNTDMGPEEQMAAAEKLAKEAMKNI